MYLSISKYSKKILIYQTLVRNNSDCVDIHDKRSLLESRKRLLCQYLYLEFLRRKQKG